MIPSVQQFHRPDNVRSHHGPSFSGGDAFQHPDNVQITSSIFDVNLASARSEWSDVNDQLGYLISIASDNNTTTASSGHVSFSPIRSSRGGPVNAGNDRGTTTVYPSQQLNTKNGGDKYEHSSDDDVKMPPLPPLSSPPSFVPSQRFSNQFGGATVSSNAARVDDGYAAVSLAYQCMDVEPVASIKQEPLDENTEVLDSFSLDESTLLDLNPACSTSSDMGGGELNDPKGVYAKKTSRLNGESKPKGNKSSSERSKKSFELSAGVGIVPTNLDILRGRGGLTNRHEGNMKFRDEARKLRSVYRDDNTTRHEKFRLSQVSRLVHCTGICFNVSNRNLTVLVTPTFVSTGACEGCQGIRWKVS